jgi:hypothetical protein
VVDNCSGSSRTTFLKATVEENIESTSVMNSHPLTVERPLRPWQAIVPVRPAI